MILLMPFFNASYPFLLIRFKAHAVYQIQAAAVYIWAVKTQDCCSQKPGRTEHLKTRNKTRSHHFFHPSGIIHMTQKGKLIRKWLRLYIYIDYIYKVKGEFHCSGIYLEWSLI